MKETTTLNIFTKLHTVVAIYIVVSILIAVGWHILLAENLTREFGIMWTTRPQGTTSYINILLCLVHI